MKRFFYLSAMLLLLGGAFAFTTATGWKLSKDYEIQFSTKGVSGIFKTFAATVEFDETDLANSKFVMNIDVNSINTGNGLQNKHAIGDEWFDAEKHPKIKFTSTSFEKTSSGFSVKGKLQVKNTTKEISIPFTFKKSGAKGTFNAKFSIDRTIYGVGKASNDVGNTITIEAKIPVTKK